MKNLTTLIRAGKSSLPFFALIITFALASCGKKEARTEEVKKDSVTTSSQWSTAKANEWYAKQGIVIGSNYVPYNAINQLEMFQAATFDTATIDKEMGMAEALGMNTMRVFLHDLLWKEDAAGFKQRLDTFLAICAKHNIKPMVVFFDSVWDPNPKLGTQKEPTPGVHNSGWVQSPGAVILTDSTQWGELERYVTDIVTQFKDDDRILAWDMVNEPDNEVTQYEATPDKAALGFKLARKSFQWARNANASQPITSAPWKGDWSSDDKLDDMSRWLFANSDIITFHNYSDSTDFRKRVEQLQRYDRPLICSEYLARSVGSKFETIIPIAKRYNIGLINWGFVSGKTNTKYPWSSWEKAFTKDPQPWHHEIFHENGKPYSEAEVKVIKGYTGK